MYSTIQVPTPLRHCYSCLQRRCSNAPDTIAVQLMLFRNRWLSGWLSAFSRTLFYSDRSAQRSLPSTVPKDRRPVWPTGNNRHPSAKGSRSRQHHFENKHFFNHMMWFTSAVCRSTADYRIRRIYKYNMTQRYNKSYSQSTTDWRPSSGTTISNRTIFFIRYLGNTNHLWYNVILVL